MFKSSEVDKPMERLIYYKDTECELHFEQMESFFCAGDKIKGTFTLISDSEQEIDEIFILLEGLVNVNWEENVVENQNGIAVPTVVKFHGSEGLMHSPNLIYSKDVVPVAGRSYSFEISIPSETIPSCNVKHGNVKYELSALCRYKDADELKSFFNVPIVIRKSIVWPVDLCKQNSYELTKYAWSWWPCKPKPVTAVIKLSSLVFSPGDRIEYNITMIEPATFKCIQRLSFHIIQVQYLQSSKPYHKFHKEYISVESNILEQELSSNKNKSYDGSLLIPSNIPISCQDKCILQTSYKLQISLAVYGGIGTDSTLAIPLQIAYDELKLKAPVKSSLNIHSESQVLESPYLVNVV